MLSAILYLEPVPLYCLLCQLVNANFNTSTNMHGVTTPNGSLHLLFNLFIMFVDDKTIEFYEYATFFNTLLAQVKMATAREVKFNDLITKADIDGDDMLTAAELWSIVAPSDTNSKVT